jgi:hypothetical protein
MDLKTAGRCTETGFGVLRKIKSQLFGFYFLIFFITYNRRYMSLLIIEKISDKCILLFLLKSEAMSS